MLPDSYLESYLDLALILARSMVLVQWYPDHPVVPGTVVPGTQLPKILGTDQDPGTKILPRSDSDPAGTVRYRLYQDFELLPFLQSSSCNDSEVSEVQNKIMILGPGISWSLGELLVSR